MEEPKPIIILKRYGFISFSKYPDNIFINAFVIYKKYRGRGKARKLAQYLPKQCKLLALPLEDCPLSMEQLINFYKSIDFVLESNNFMVRK